MVPAIATGQSYLDLVEADSPRPLTKQSQLTTFAPSNASQYDMWRAGLESYRVNAYCMPTSVPGAETFNASTIQSLYTSCDIKLYLLTATIQFTWQQSTSVSHVFMH